MRYSSFLALRRGCFPQCRRLPPVQTLWCDRGLESAKARPSARFFSLRSAVDMPNALVFLADGSEEMEVVITVDVLRRGGVDVKLVGLSGMSPATCSRNVKIVPDIDIGTLTDSDLLDAAIVPGGLKGAEAMAADANVGKILKTHEDAGKVVAAICAGPTVFKSHSIGLGKRVTSHPSVKDQLASAYSYSEDRVVEDGNLVTSRGPGTAFEFALALVAKLCGKEKADSLVPPMLVKV